MTSDLLPLVASDESLWRAGASGDQRAFSELYERHARTIYNYLFRRLGDWSEAEDLTAVVFLEAFRRRGEAAAQMRSVLKRNGVYVMNADGSGQRMLARDSAPPWSPDGRKVAFVSDRDGTYEVYVMNADGSGQKKLTHHGS